MGHLTEPPFATTSIARRGVLGTGLAAGLTAATSLVAGPVSAAARGADDDPSARRVVIVGANPGLQLFDGDRVTGYISAWRVDWSSHGAGTAVIMWHRDTVHVYSSTPRLARWLERDFTRHFPEVEGLPWPEPIMHRTPARVQIDLDRGVRVQAGDLAMHLGDVRDQRQWITDDFGLGGVDHSLHLVLAPCFDGWARVGGRMMEGEIATSGTPDRPGSSAFVTEAEVWRR